MPYCCQCGKQVGAADRFCRLCGARQAGIPDAPQDAGSGFGSGSNPGSGGPQAGSSWPGQQASSGSYAGSGRRSGDPLAGLSDKHAAMLCYIPWLGWILAIVVLGSDRFRRNYEARFHAYQGLFLFAAWLVVDWVLSPVLAHTGLGFFAPIPRAGLGVVQLMIVAGWIVMLVKANRGEHYRLPLIGEMAERSVNEHRV